MNKVISILFLFFGVFLSGQEAIAQKELIQKANEIFELLDKDPKNAFKQAKIIENEAQKLNVKEAELKAINIKCGYYRIENDFEKMMEAGKLLSKKSSIYKMPYYQVIAKRLLFESYLFSGLPKRAFQELEDGRKLLNKLDEKETQNIIEKTNFFIAYSNYYLLKEDYKNQLKYIKAAGEELEKLPEEDYSQKLLCVHYSNLAASYNKNNEKDSAKYYAKLSQSKGEKYNINELRFNNLVVLGDVGMSESKYEEALNYYKEAEKLGGYKNHLDIEVLYDNIILANKNLEREDNVKIYTTKKDSLKLTISENQNKSLHKLLNEKEQSDTVQFKYIVLILFVLIIIFTIFFIRRNRILLQQEKISDLYLDEVSNFPSGEDYSRLLNLLKDNDPAFMIYFEEAFPRFGSELKKINPKISDSELEFCALLKLKIPTKEIAQYKFRAPQTIRNKKYIIRNKLHIPKDKDIYEWFDEL